MAGEVASLLISRMAVPVLYFMLFTGEASHRWAHSRTGIEVHPGASLGNRVKLYRASSRGSFPPPAIQIQIDHTSST